MGSYCHFFPNTDLDRTREGENYSTCENKTGLRRKMAAYMSHVLMVVEFRSQVSQ